MASVKPIVGPNGKARAWKVRYREPGNQNPRSQTFATQREAKDFEAQLEHDKRAGTYIDHRLGQQSVRDYGRRWAAAQAHSENTRRGVNTALGHVEATFGDRAIASVRYTEMQAFATSLSVTMKASSAETVWAWVAGMFKAAVLDEVIRTSPCAKVKGPEPLPTEIVLPTLTEIYAVTAHLPACYRRIVLLGAQAGLRPAELRGLSVGQIDLDGATLKVDRQRDGDREWGPKTRSSYRTVPIEAMTVDLLRLQMGEYRNADGLVFHNSWGHPLSNSGMAKQWRTAVALAGARPGLRMHDLRHFYASALIAQGCSVALVARRLGHNRDGRETLRTYTHLWPSEDTDTRSAITNAFNVES